MVFRSNALIAITILLMGLFAAGAIVAFAQIENIEYPIPELGNCENEQDCHDYCDDVSNINQCLDFAEKHGLLSDRELEDARRFESAGASGPGGCDSLLSCELYCSDLNNIRECLAYGEEHGFLEGEELEEARAVQRALDSGVPLPNGCTDKESCKAYCEDPATASQCFDFAVAAGFIAEDEIEHIEKAMRLMASGQSPGGCQNEKECEEYCSEDGHHEECLLFAEQAGFISPEDAAFAREHGLTEGPGGCRGDECDSYCDDEANFQECVDFAIDHGFIDENDAEIARRTGGKGPGGCVGEKECMNFCEDPNNEDVCYQFAIDHDIFSEEDKRSIEEGRKQFEQAYNEAAPDVRVCLERAFGSRFAGLLDGSRPMDIEDGEIIRKCFEEYFSNQEADSDRFLDIQEDGSHFDETRPHGFEGDFGPAGEPIGNFDDFEAFKDDFNGSIDDFESFKDDFREDFFDGHHDEPHEFDAAGNSFDGGFQDEFDTQFEDELQRQYEDELQRQIEEEKHRQYEEEMRRQYEEELQKQFDALGDSPDQYDGHDPDGYDGLYDGTNIQGSVYGRLLGNVLTGFRSLLYK